MTVKDVLRFLNDCDLKDLKKINKLVDSLIILKERELKAKKEKKAKLSSSDVEGIIEYYLDEQIGAADEEGYKETIHLVKKLVKMKKRVDFEDFYTVITKEYGKKADETKFKIDSLIRRSKVEKEKSWELLEDIFGIVVFQRMNVSDFVIGLANYIRDNYFKKS